MSDTLIKKYGQWVGNTNEEIEQFHEGGHRTRQVRRLSQVAATLF